MPSSSCQKFLKKCHSILSLYCAVDESSWVCKFVLITFQISDTGCGTKFYNSVLSSQYFIPCAKVHPPPTEDTRYGIQKEAANISSQVQMSIHEAPDSTQIQVTGASIQCYATSTPTLSALQNGVGIYYLKKGGVCWWWVVRRDEKKGTCNGEPKEEKCP